MRSLISIVFLIVLLGCADSTTSRDSNSDKQPNTKPAIPYALAKVRLVTDPLGITIDTVNNLFFGEYPIGIVNDRAPGPTDYHTIWTFKIIKTDSLVLEQTGILDQPLERDYYYKDSLPDQIKKDFFATENFKPKKVYSLKPFDPKEHQSGFFIMTEDSLVYLSMSTK